MNDTLIINGITYRAVKEEKKPERLGGWIKANDFEGWHTAITKSKVEGDDTFMAELRYGEIIVSEDEVKKILDAIPVTGYEEHLRALRLFGFKKDGAE